MAKTQSKFAKYIFLPSKSPVHYEWDDLNFHKIATKIKVPEKP
jgi:hypothetical protein